MMALANTLAAMWRSREKQKLPYLLVNDVRSSAGLAGPLQRVAPHGNRL